GLSMLKEIRERMLPKMHPHTDSRVYNRELVEALETENLLLLSEIFIEMALMKKESRGTFRRIDYPDESKYFTSVKLRLKNGEKNYHVVKIPIPED
ncbi:MAG: hypothetical protein RMJ31_06770, partial [Nitrososphaerota archaeon]|nr:hypothetical protein [Nitrososphaerota archaeon]